MRSWTALFVAAAIAAPAVVAAQGQQPIFRGATELVRVDVIVTDDDGRFVDDLRPQDFRVFEDGEEQRLVDMQLVDLRSGVVQRAASGRAPEAEPSGIMMPDDASAGSDASKFGAIVFFIDGTSIDMTNKARFAEAWREVIDDTDSLQVPRAAYIVDSNRRVRQLVPFTSDTAQLREATEVLEEVAAFGNSIYRRMGDVARSLGQPGIGWEVKSLEAEENQRSFDSLRHLTQFCSALGARPGRKALVWVSSGVKLMEGGPYTAILSGGGAGAGGGGGGRSAGGNTAKDTWGTEFAAGMPERMLIEAQEELHQAANSANVSIYAIDPTPRGDLRQAGTGAQVGSAGVMNVLTSLEVQSSLEAMRDSLREAAAETGGRAFIHWSELPSALAEIEDDTSRFYLLAYTPPSPKDGEYHEISVRVERPGLSVRQRQGYLALADEERNQRAAAAALQLPGAARGLDVSTHVSRKWNTVGQPLVQLAVSISGAGPVIPDSSGLDAAPLRVLFLALDDEQRSVEQFDREVLRRVVDGELTADAEPFVYLDWRWWTLDSGTYDFRVAVLDSATGNIGASQVEVEVPQPSTGWRISDLMLGVLAGGGSLQPLVTGRAPAQSTISAFAEVYGGAEPMATLRVLPVDELGEAVDNPWAVVEAGALLRYDDNIHRASIQLPRPLAPGKYVVELIIIDFTTRKEARLRTPIEIF